MALIIEETALHELKTADYAALQDLAQTHHGICDQFLWGEMEAPDITYVRAWEVKHDAPTVVVWTVSTQRADGTAYMEGSALSLRDAVTVWKACPPISPQVVEVS